MICKKSPKVSPPTGDTWRARHDTGKLAIVRECINAGLVHDCEVYGLFSDLIPAQALAQGEALEWGRARQGLIPDFRLRLPTPGGTTDRLAELKFVSAGISWFPRGAKGKGTDRRAAGLPQLYRKKLIPFDSKYHHTPDGQTGPLVRRLESYGRLEGLVVGPWGDASKDLHNLVKVLGENKVAMQARATGREASENEQGIIISQIRKFLSTAFVRAQSLCLINRLAHLGDGAKAAAGRRNLTKRLEIGTKREREAHFAAHIRGMGLSRVGQIFVN